MKITRRAFAFLLTFSAPLFTISAPQAPHKSTAKKGQYLTYVGTYTTKKASKGVYVYRFDAATGQLTSIGLAAESTDPSFVAAHPSGKYLYAVNEIGDYDGKKSGAVSAFAIDHKRGRLTLLNQVASGGADPCYVSLDKTGKYILVANYSGGSVAVFPVLKDGRLGEASAFVQHQGSGANKERQEGPHAHSIQTSPDNRFVVVSDLGLDELVLYHFDAAKGSIVPNEPPFAKVSPGAGPRHAAFHPNGKFVYVLNEMQSSLMAFSYDKATATLKTLQQISTLPKDFTGQNNTAELVVHPSGKFLYASNRGHDSIAIFSIDSVKGTLTPAGHVPTGGKTPRNFAIDPTGKYLFAANQASDNIVIFRINPVTGNLTSSGQVVEVPSPVDITFVAE
jgi:6-phosphogluconolactonase